VTATLVSVIVLPEMILCLHHRVANGIDCHLPYNFCHGGGFQNPPDASMIDALVRRVPACPRVSAMHISFRIPPQVTGI
jgi:hypothetical protein